MTKYILTGFLLFLTSFTVTQAQFTYTYPGPPLNVQLDGELVEADYWDTIPRILSAGLGFCDIVAIDTNVLTQSSVMLAGGAWLSDITCGVDDADFTATSLKSTVQMAYIYQNEPWVLQDGAIGLDGIPIVFSWPVLTNTLDVTDFRFILNTGDTVIPYMASPFPNLENNERNCPVVFGEFGNQLPSTHPNARFPVKCEVVADNTPLMLLGPNNQMVSAVGMSWETTTSPYDPNNGPRLVGAKLNHVGTQNAGEGTDNILFNLGYPSFPNDEFALYGGGDFRLRILTSGGFSPDGVRGVKPTDFENFFRIHVLASDSTPMLLEQTDSVYAVLGGNLRILGLSDLGRVGTSYDDCYDEDRDNYIDIILEGDEAAARNITHLEIPSLAGGYGAFYNPGGPGTTPFSGGSYTAPGPPDLEPVIIALDDPWRVTVGAVTSIENELVPDHRFQVYPNPTQGAIQVQTEPDFTGQFEVYNLMGTHLLSSKEKEMDVRMLPAGTYMLLKRAADGGLQSLKFIKN